jgi:preprotein translocase subunit SecG
MEMEQIVKILIFLVVLIILIGAVVLLLQGKGAGLLDSIKRMMRFGK